MSYWASMDRAMKPLSVLLSSISFICIFAALMDSSVAADASDKAVSAATGQSSAGPGTTGAKPPSMPNPGDKLGYTKEESVKHLDPEVIAFLDGILRLYREPGLFANRLATFEALGIVPGNVIPLPTRPTREPETLPFRQYATPIGLFARYGWGADYVYSGREYLDGKLTWHSLLTIQVSSKAACVDSRAVEGYLDLYLWPDRYGVHPLPVELWDRHGIGGSAVARKLSTLTPGMTVGFAGGCLNLVAIGGIFKYEELGDANVIVQ